MGSTFFTPISHSRSSSHSGVRTRITFLNEIYVPGIILSYYPQYPINRQDFHGSGVNRVAVHVSFLIRNTCIQNLQRDLFNRRSKAKYPENFFRYPEGIRTGTILPGSNLCNLLSLTQPLLNKCHVSIKKQKP